jgi:hypothetical protein
MYPPEGLVEGVNVSHSGERTTAEDQYGATSFQPMIERFGGREFLTLDSVQMKKNKSQVHDQTQMPWTLLVEYMTRCEHN